MLHWALTFFVIALIAALLGFRGSPDSRRNSDGSSWWSRSSSWRPVCWPAALHLSVP